MPKADWGLSKKRQINLMRERERERKKETEREGEKQSHNPQ